MTPTMTTDDREWQPIVTAPNGVPVVVTNSFHWTLAKRVKRETQTLQLRWPFVKYDSVWVWVFSCSGWKAIDFEPSHWMRLKLEPPK
jgi:hypothetical protein